LALRSFRLFFELLFFEGGVVWFFDIFARSQAPD